VIVEATNYFAKPGLAGEVLVHRRRGNALRKAMGLPEGRIFVKVSGPGPDVRWECAFASREEFEADLAAREQSPEFGEQRKGMGELTVRFERHVEELDEG
jgi:hypothetical protein